MKKILILALIMIFMSTPVVFACKACGCSGGAGEMAEEAASHEHMADEEGSYADEEMVDEEMADEEMMEEAEEAGSM